MTDTARKLHKEGVDLFRSQNFEAALQKLEQALEETADDRHAAEINNDLGVTYKELANFEAAHAALDEAMHYFSGVDDQKGQAQTLGNRAAVYEAEDLTEEAVETYKQSATMLEEAGESELAMYVWQAVSRLRMRQKQYIAAIGAYEEGVENMPQGSFKRKLLQRLLKVPGSMLGGGASKSDDESEPDEPDDEA
jgi:tetratricopeptide (TPR) repeat protein